MYVYIWLAYKNYYYPPADERIGVPGTGALGAIKGQWLLRKSIDSFFLSYFKMHLACHYQVPWCQSFSFPSIICYSWTPNVNGAWSHLCLSSFHPFIDVKSFELKMALMLKGCWSRELRCSIRTHAIVLECRYWSGCRLSLFHSLFHHVLAGITFLLTRTLCGGTHTYSDAKGTQIRLTAFSHQVV